MHHSSASTGPDDKESHDPGGGSDNAVLHMKLPTVGYTPAKTRRMSRSLSNLHAATYLREGGGEGNREGSLSDEVTTLSDIKSEKGSEVNSAAPAGNASRRSLSSLKPKGGYLRDSLNEKLSSSDAIMEDMRTMMKDLDSLVASNNKKTSSRKSVGPGTESGVSLREKDGSKRESGKHLPPLAHTHSGEASPDSMTGADFSPRGPLLSDRKDGSSPLDKKSSGVLSVPGLGPIGVKEPHQPFTRPTSPDLPSDEVRPSLGDREHRNSRGRVIVTKADKRTSVSEILPAGYRHDLGLKDIGSSRRRFHYDSRSLAGKKDGKDKVNQDSFLTRDPWRIPGLDAGNDFQLFALMDGHGDQGEKVSNYIKVNLPLVLAEEAGLKENNIMKVLLNGIEKMCKDLAADKTVDSKMSGSTLVCCIIHGSKLYVANIGDSRCIMGRRRNAGSTSGLRVIALTTDQHPDRPDEMQRIVASKQGMVSRIMSDDGHYVGPLRVWAKDGTGAGLAMSRSIGDEDSHKNGVISIPEVLERGFDELDQFLIFASDGVWDYITCEEAVEMVEKERVRGKSPKDCATILTDEARSRWGTSDHVDDISAIIVFLQ